MEVVVGRRGEPRDEQGVAPRGVIVDESLDVSRGLAFGEDRLGQADSCLTLVVEADVVVAQAVVAFGSGTRKALPRL
jgi:hypothetical protein